MSIVDHSFKHQLELEELVANPFAGGIMNQGVTSAVCSGGRRLQQEHRRIGFWYGPPS
ncbi:hypothetical protein ACFLUE_01520 [Chloroflexota bacterium]